MIRNQGVGDEAAIAPSSGGPSGDPTERVSFESLGNSPLLPRATSLQVGRRGPSRAAHATPMTKKMAVGSPARHACISRVCELFAYRSSISIGPPTHDHQGSFCSPAPLSRYAEATLAGSSFTSCTTAAPAISGVTRGPDAWTNDSRYSSTERPARAA